MQRSGRNAVTRASSRTCRRSSGRKATPRGRPFACYRTDERLAHSCSHSGNICSRLENIPRAFGLLARAGLSTLASPTSFERALQDDRAELAFDADEVFGADREADAFEPGAGEAYLGDFASRGARAIACARAEQARSDVRQLDGRRMRVAGVAMDVARDVMRGRVGGACEPCGDSFAMEVTVAGRGGDGAAQG